MSEPAYEMGSNVSVFRCWSCGYQFWDASSDDVQAHLRCEHMDEHRSSDAADRGGAMDATCIDCNRPIARNPPHQADRPMIRQALALLRDAAIILLALWTLGACLGVVAFGYSMVMP